MITFQKVNTFRVSDFPIYGNISAKLWPYLSRFPFPLFVSRKGNTFRVENPRNFLGFPAGIGNTFWVKKRIMWTVSRWNRKNSHATVSFSYKIFLLQIIWRNVMLSLDLGLTLDKETIIFSRFRKVGTGICNQKLIVWKSAPFKRCMFIFERIRIRFLENEKFILLHLFQSFYESNNQFSWKGLQSLVLSEITRIFEMKMLLFWI